jgi:hypothetical protein
MSARVILTPSYPNEGIVRNAAPVSARTWQNIAQNINYALGSGMQLIPCHVPHGGSAVVAKNSSVDFHYRVEPRAQAMARVWTVVTQPTAGGRAQFTMQSPAGSGTTVTAYSADRGTLTPVLYTQTLSSQSSAEAELSMRIAVGNGASDNDLQVMGIGCFEIPRAVLAQSTTDYGVDIESCGHRQPIYDATSAYLSVTGCTTSLYQARIASRRSFLQQAWGSSTSLAWSTTSTSYANVTEGAVPILGRKLYNGETTRNMRYKVYARHSAGGVSCSVRLTMANGATTTSTFTPTTSFTWLPSSAATIAVHSEDLDASDGRRSTTWDTATIDAKLDSASGTLYIASVCAWESVNDA